MNKMEGEKRGDGNQVNGDQVKYSFGRGPRIDKIWIGVPIGF